MVSVDKVGGNEGRIEANPGEKKIAIDAANMMKRELGMRPWRSKFVATGGKNGVCFLVGYEKQSRNPIFLNTLICWEKAVFRVRWRQWLKV